MTFAVLRGECPGCRALFYTPECKFSLSVHRGGAGGAAEPSSLIASRIFLEFSQLNFRNQEVAQPVGCSAPRWPMAVSLILRCGCTHVVHSGWPGGGGGVLPRGSANALRHNFEKKNVGLNSVPLEQCFDLGLGLRFEKKSTLYLWVDKR